MEVVGDETDRSGESGGDFGGAVDASFQPGDPGQQRRQQEAALVERLFLIEQHQLFHPTADEPVGAHVDRAQVVAENSRLGFKDHIKGAHEAEIDLAVLQVRAG